MPETKIDFIDLTYIIEGKVTYYVNNVAYEAGKGDLICIPRRSLRRATMDPEHLMVAYAANLWFFYFDGGEAALPFPVRTAIGLHDDLLILYRELNAAWTEKASGYPIKVAAILLNILHKYYRLIVYRKHDNIVNKHIGNALDFIQENFHSSIDVQELAESEGLNPSYFGTLFKKQTGMGVREYINRFRIDNAENMLIGGEFTIAEAAYRCGFEDPFYFSKVFKKLKGYPPSVAKLNRDFE